LRPKQLKAKDLRAFTIVPIRALGDPRVSASTFRVLAAYCSYADRIGRTFVSQGRLSETLGCSKSGVSYHAVKLRKLGYMVYCKPFYPGQRSTSNRIVYEPKIKLEETIKSSLSVKHQMEISEAESMLKDQIKQGMAGTNSGTDQRLSKLMVEFQSLTTDFFTAAIAKGWWISHDQAQRSAKMLANQAVELLREPHSNETGTA
jgi:hypothetical protein